MRTSTGGGGPTDGHVRTWGRGGSKTSKKTADVLCEWPLSGQAGISSKNGTYVLERSYLHAKKKRNVVEIRVISEFSFPKQFSIRFFLACVSGVKIKWE